MHTRESGGGVRVVVERMMVQRESDGRGGGERVMVGGRENAGGEREDDGGERERWERE